MWKYFPCFVLSEKFCYYLFRAPRKKIKNINYIFSDPCFSVRMHDLLSTLKRIHVSNVNTNIKFMQKN